MSSGEAEVILGTGAGPSKLRWFSDPDAPGYGGVPPHAIQAALRAFAAELDRHGVQYRIEARQENVMMGVIDSGRQFRAEPDPPKDPPIVQLAPECCLVFTRLQEEGARLLRAAKAGITLRRMRGERLTRRHARRPPPKGKKR